MVFLRGDKQVLVPVPGHGLHVLLQFLLRDVRFEIGIAVHGILDPHENGLGKIHVEGDFPGVETLFQILQDALAEPGMKQVPGHIYQAGEIVLTDVAVQVQPCAVALLLVQECHAKTVQRTGFHLEQHFPGQCLQDGAQFLVGEAALAQAALGENERGLASQVGNHCHGHGGGGTGQESQNAADDPPLAGARRLAEAMVHEDAVEVVGAVNEKALTGLGEDHRRGLAQHDGREDLHDIVSRQVGGTEYAGQGILVDTVISPLPGGFQFAIADECKMVFRHPAEEGAVFRERRTLQRLLHPVRQGQCRVPHVTPVSRDHLDIGNCFVECIDEDGMRRLLHRIHVELDECLQDGPVGTAAGELAAAIAFDRVNPVLGIALYLEQRVVRSFDPVAQVIERDGEGVDQEWMVIRYDADQGADTGVQRHQVIDSDQRLSRFPVPGQIKVPERCLEEERNPVFTVVLGRYPSVVILDKIQPLLARQGGHHLVNGLHEFVVNRIVHDCSRVCCAVKHDRECEHGEQY